jgi:hypothetical protein
MRFKGPLSAVLLAAVMTLAPGCAFAREDSDDWQFSATVYGWFPDIGGHTSFQADTVGTIDVDISTILEHLKMTFQGSFEARRGRWGAFTDFVYLDVGDSRSGTRGLEINGQPLPATVTAVIDLDLKSLFWTLAGTCRIAESDRATLDILLGVRLASFKPAIDWQFSGNFGSITPPPLTGDREESIDQWDAIMGARGRIAFGADHQWSMPYHFDVGAGDSDLTFQAMVGLARTFGWGDLGVGWRYLDYDVRSDRPVSDMNFSGPAMGATFRW